MIIDVHAHTFPAKIASHALGVLSSNSHTRPFTDGTIQGLSASMSESGITCSVIQPVATKPEQVKRINDTAMKINAGESSEIYSFGGIHPFFEDCCGELVRISEAGIKGVKIHPVYQGLNIDDERYARILKFAGELGLIVMIHAGWDIGFPGDDSALPERIARVLDVCDCRVILAHMGGWRCWNESAKLFAGRENVYVDTAFSLGRFYPNDDGYYHGDDECVMLSDDEFVRMIHDFGSERVIFGTDSPWSSQKECVKEFMSLPLDDNEKQNILYNNASKLLGFNTRKILSEENLCQAKC